MSGIPGCFGNTWMFWKYLDVLEIPGCFGNAWMFWKYLDVLEMPGCFGNTFGKAIKIKIHLWKIKNIKGGIKPDFFHVLNAFSSCCHLFTQRGGAFLMR